MDLTKKVHKNVLNVLLEKERKIDSMIDEYTAFENKITKQQDEETIETIRSNRLRHLKQLYEKRYSCMANGYGRIIHIESDRDFFDACKSANSILIHFYRPTTRRCEYLDSHLIKIATIFFDTKFLKVNVEKTPFICDRFKIWCLPTLMIVKNGHTDHSIVGFDEFGGDGFSTEILIKVLNKHGIKAPE